MKALILFFTFVSFCAQAQVVKKKDKNGQVYKYEAVDTIGTFVELLYDTNIVFNRKMIFGLRMVDSIAVFKNSSKNIFFCSIEHLANSGDFDLLINNKIYLNRISIKKNAINKFTFPYEGTILFTYRDNRGRPVLLKAQVSNRNGLKRDSLDINCSEPAKVIPGDYSISIDVLPPYEVVTEVSFGATTEVQLPQEGAVDLNATGIFSHMKLFYDKSYYRKDWDFEELKNFNLKKHCVSGQIKLRPGQYKIVGIIDGVRFEIFFIIKSNLITYITNRKSDEKTPFLPTTGDFLYKP